MLSLHLALALARLRLLGSKHDFMDNDPHKLHEHPQPVKSQT